MRRDLKKLERGRIIWADFFDPQGKDSGRHPAMIITQTDDIEKGEPIIAVVISTKRYAKAHEMIEMRFDPRGHPVTGLKLSVSF